MGARGEQSGFVGPAGLPSFPVVCREQRNNVDCRDQSLRKASLNRGCGGKGWALRQRGPDVCGQEREAQPGVALRALRGGEAR